MAANHQHLRAFHAIAIEGGVSRAARRLHVSQPALSQQLKALEVRHGVSLFEGRKTPLKLTPAGRVLFALTQKMFATASEIDDLLGETAGPTGGSLRLGSDHPYYAAKIVELFRRQNSRADVQVRMGNAHDVMRWLGDAQIDAAVASDPAADGAFSYEPLASDGLFCALPHNHPLAGQGRISIAALAAETLLLREAASKTRTFTERALADADITPRGTIELQCRETIREAIALGLGISVFLTSECPPDPRIIYCPLDTGARDYKLQTYLVCQKDRRRSGFMRALQSVASEMRELGR